MEETEEFYAGFEILGGKNSTLYGGPKTMFKYCQIGEDCVSK